MRNPSIALLVVLPCTLVLAQRTPASDSSSSLVQDRAISSSAVDKKPPVFVFGGRPLHAGMSQREAVASLSACCKLSPPAESEVEGQPAPAGTAVGHFILPKEELPRRILGTVYFSGGKVARVTRPLDDEVDSYSDDVVAFARALKRSISAETGDSDTTVLISLRHERVSNGESDVVSFVFLDGRGIELHVGTLDKPEELTNKRDFATLDEDLEPPR